jgi:hypothetical protein
LLSLLFKDDVNRVLKTNFASIAPKVPRNDLATAFLTGFKGVNQLKQVTPSEMTRLNTGIDAVAADKQSNFGVAGGDVAGFPNGRRPGDDTVDIALRVVMGALCHLDLNPKVCDGDPAVVAPVGLAPFTDGAPVSAMDFDTEFPYLTTPLAGAGQDYSAGYAK